MNHLLHPVNGRRNEIKALLLAVGTCFTLPATATLLSGAGTGLCVLVTVLLSELAIIPMRKSLPPVSRAIAFAILNVTLTVLLYLLLDKFLPTLFKEFGRCLPLTAIGGCLFFLARDPSEENAFCKLSRLGSATAHLAVLLTLIGAVREFLGRGGVLGASVWRFSLGYFTYPASAFFLYGVLLALFFPAVARVNTGLGRRSISDGVLAASFLLSACYVFTLIG